MILWILIPIAIVSHASGVFSFRKRLTSILKILFGSMLAFTAWKTCLDYSRLKSSPDGPFPDAVKCTTVFLTVDNERRIALLILYAMVFLGEAGVSIQHTALPNILRMFSYSDCIPNYDQSKPGR